MAASHSSADRYWGLQIRATCAYFPFPLCPRSDHESLVICILQCPLANNTRRLPSRDTKHTNTQSLESDVGHKVKEDGSCDNRLCVASKRGENCDSRRSFPQPAACNTTSGTSRRIILLIATLQFDKLQLIRPEASRKDSCQDFEISSIAWVNISPRFA